LIEATETGCRCGPSSGLPPSRTAASLKLEDPIHGALPAKWTSAVTNGGLIEARIEPTITRPAPVRPPPTRTAARVKRPPTSLLPFAPNQDFRRHERRPH